MFIRSTTIDEDIRTNFQDKNLVVCINSIDPDCLLSAEKGEEYYRHRN